MISVRDIQKIENEKNKARKDTFREILKQFDKKIRYAVEVNEKQVFLSVPAMIFGYPLYDIKSATMYLARQLKRLGYTVQELGGPNLYVTWELKRNNNHYEESEDKQDEFELPTLVNLKKMASQIRSKK
jgi:hypothetical protein